MFCHLSPPFICSGVRSLSRCFVHACRFCLQVLSYVGAFKFQSNVINILAYLYCLSLIYCFVCSCVVSLWLTSHICSIYISPQRVLSCWFGFVELWWYCFCGSSDSQSEWTALMYAATYGHVDCARLLIDAGADKEVKDNNNVRVGRCFADAPSWFVSHFILIYYLLDCLLFRFFYFLTASVTFSLPLYLYHDMLLPFCFLRFQ